jgi:hypothetical protein
MISPSTNLLIHIHESLYDKSEDQNCNNTAIRVDSVLRSLVLSIKKCILSIDGCNVKRCRV